MAQRGIRRSPFPKSRFSARLGYCGNQPLNPDDVESAPLREIFRRAIEQHLAQGGGKPEELRILDFGCGRGRLVGRLRARGFRAHGVDAEASFVQEGLGYFAARYPEEPVLSVLDGDGRTTFPDDYFDLVVSEEVLEHVYDLDGLAREIARITKPGGIGVHAYPGRWRLVEPHLKLPLVHWFPDNASKKLALRALLWLGAGADFEEFRDLGLAERADVYYEYLSTETFYTSNRSIVRCFERHGHSCETEGSSASNKVVLRTRRR